MAITKDDVEAIILRAVEAGRVAAERSSRDAYSATEKRLYALPVLREKITDDLERLEEMEQYGPRGKDKSIVRFQRTGSRLSPEEIQQALITDLRATIAADRQEVDTVESALETVRREPYYFTVEWKYFRDMDDAAIGAKSEPPRDASTICRQRRKLVQKIAVRLYGAAAAN